MARAAVLGRLTWTQAELVELVHETPRVASLLFNVPDWPGHLAGQHVDVRLTAADGYQAERSYSIASPPEERWIALTVERLDDGDVSPYLVGEAKRSLATTTAQYLWVVVRAQLKCQVRRRVRCGGLHGTGSLRAACGVIASRLRRP